MNNPGPASERLYIGVSPMVKKALAGFKISRAVRARQWLFTNGQMDMGDGGKVLNPGDLMAQTVTCMRSVYEVTARADCRLAELAQLQIFYLAGSVTDEAAYRAQILEEFPECRDVLIVMTPVPSFATIGSEVEIDAISVKGQRAAVTNDEGAVLGVRRGDWVFASDRVSRGADHIGSGLSRTLARMGSDLRDVCRLYAYYPAGAEAQRSAIERQLAEIFREAPPAYHATILPASARSDFAVELEVIGHAGTEAVKVRSGLATSPSTDLDWPFVETLRCAEVIFASGQFPLDGRGAIAHPGNIADQARTIMRRLDRALRHAGVGMPQLTKIKTYYDGTWNQENWFDNLRARMEMLSDPGPASSGIEGLLPVMDGALLSVDGIAVLDDLRDA